MYNSFLAQKQEEQCKQLSKKQNKMKKWQHRYKTEVMPTLVGRFNRRMNGFVKKMEDEPVTLPLEEKKKGDSLLIRQFDQKLNVGQDKFRFKNSMDWKSIYTTIERAQREQLIKHYQKNHMDSTMAFRGTFSQSKYEPFRPQYRSRQRTKQINPAMRYATKNTSATLQVLPNIKKNNKSLSLDRRMLTNPQKSSSQKRQDDGLTNSNQGNNSSLDYLLNISTARRIQVKVQQKSEQQIREEQQLKLLAQDRLYFKSLQNIELKMEINGEKTALKNLLEKCGVNKKSPLKNRKQQTDVFMEFIKKNQLFGKFI